MLLIFTDYIILFCILLHSHCVFQLSENTYYYIDRLCLYRQAMHTVYDILVHYAYQYRSILNMCYIYHILRLCLYIDYMLYRSYFRLNLELSSAYFTLSKTR